jgi:hypothetical protein
MSGPKSSRYTLTAAQRRAIQRQIEEQLIRMQRAIEEEQRRIREQKRLDELNSFKSNIASAKSSMDALHSVISDIKNCVADDERDPAGLLALHDFCRAMDKKIQTIEEVDEGSSFEELHARNKELSKAFLTIQDAQVKAGAIQKKQADIYRIKMLERLNLDFNISFKGIANRKKLEESEYIPQIIEALDEISVMELSSDLKDKLETVKEKSKEIVSTDFLQNYYAITVIPFVKECRAYDELLMKHGQEYENLTSRYKVLANEMGCSVEEIPFNNGAIDILLEKISQLEKQLLEKKEEEYICNSIDDAMVELGYKTVGARNVTSKNGRHFRSELYKVDEGTVVNVTYADDGQVTMELGAADVEDRVPTDQEKRSLVEDMTKFCGDYAEVERKLKEKGIEPKRISVLPPYAEYAQIIDVSEFEMTGDVGHYSLTRNLLMQL